MASMLSHSTVQPQVVGALSQLSSLFSGVRNLHASGKVFRSRKETLGPVTNDSEALNKSTSPCPEEGPLPADLNLADLSLADIDRMVFSPILSLLKSEESHWNQSHVSAESFFENKNGFPEACLRTDFPALSQIVYSHNFKKLLQRKDILPLVQQRRGFRTRKTSLGLGKDEEETYMDKFRQMFMMSGGKKSPNETNSFTKMVSDHDHHPDFQDKLRVAFAEGYHANKIPAAPEKKSFLNRLGKIAITFGTFVLIVYAWQTIAAINGTGVRGGLGVLKGDRFEVSPEEITVTFDDVKGVTEAKQELQDIVEFLRDPDKFTSLGAKLPKGVLLVGPPGIGKTLLARAVAGEAGVPFFHASGSEFDEIFVGTGAKRVRQMFTSAKMRSPCVVFIDEIDSVGAKRTSSQIHPYANQTINQLLSEMDGFKQNTGVIVLGATNKLENLDSALLRPGRFDVEVRVFPPDKKEREEILNYYISKIIADRDIDTALLAAGTIGFTGADLENMVNQAALKAAIDGAMAVNMDHMDFARDKVLMGPEKKAKIPDEETNWVTAYHEAGHTLVAYYSKDDFGIHKVTIMPRGMSLGHTSYINEKEVYNHTKSQLLAQMDICMGGRVGEEVAFGTDKITTGASNDFQKATKIATLMVKMYGMSDKVGVRSFNGENPVDSGLSMVKVNEVSPAIQEQVDSEIKRLLQESYDRAKQVLQSHQKELKALAQALMKYETLDKSEIITIVEGKKLSKS